MAVSGKNGEFTIKNLPAGRELEFVLWQEKLGFLSAAEASGIKIDGKGRFKLKLAADEAKQIEFTLK